MIANIVKLALLRSYHIFSARLPHNQCRYSSLTNLPVPIVPQYHANLVVMMLPAHEPVSRLCYRLLLLPSRCLA